MNLNQFEINFYTLERKIILIILQSKYNFVFYVAALFPALMHLLKLH